MKCMPLVALLACNVLISDAFKLVGTQRMHTKASLRKPANSSAVASTPDTVALANSKEEVSAQAPAPAPSGPTLPAVKVSFELENYNYYDMDKAVHFPDEVVNVTGFLNYTIPPMPGLDYTIPGYGKAELTYTIPENASAQEIAALVREPPGGWKKPNSVLVSKRAHVGSAHVGVKASDGKIMHIDGSLSLKAKPSIVQSSAKAFMELAAKKKTTVMHVLKDAIEEAVTKVVKAGLQKKMTGLAPAPAAALLGVAPAPSSTEAPSGRMFVKITPGRPAILSSFIQVKSAEEPTETEVEEGANTVAEDLADDEEDIVTTATDDAKEVEEDAKDAAEDVEAVIIGTPPPTTAPEMQQPGKSTDVEVLIMNDPNSGKDMLADYMSVLNGALQSGELEKLIASSLCEATGIGPVITGLAVNMTEIESWEVGKCELHMQTLVSRFSMAYTRRMVPTAIFNECTNFIPKVSFSHDDMVNKADIYRCRVATAKFSKGWQFGQGAKVPIDSAPSPSPTLAASPGPASGPAPPTHKFVQLEYKQLCFDFCEIKFGKLAPQCHVTSGDKLLAAGPAGAAAASPS